MFFFNIILSLSFVKYFIFIINKYYFNKDQDEDIYDSDDDINDPDYIDNQESDEDEDEIKILDSMEIIQDEEIENLKNYDFKKE